jgi:hypothetical protein
MKKPAENIWVLPYSLRLFGADLRRMVTVIRLRSGELIIHSTGPFTQGDVAGIMRLGKPGWLLDVKLRHDTFTKQGPKHFRISPSLPRTAFRNWSDSRPSPSFQHPRRGATSWRSCGWKGSRDMREHLVFHRPSRTLIAADLLFNLVLTFRPGPAFWPFAPLAPDTILACRGRSEWRSKTRRPSNDP